MRRVRKILTSLRLTISLILALGAIFLLGLWIPQKGLLEFQAYQNWQKADPVLVSILEFLGLTDIYRSPIALSLWVLFFINLSLVMWQRLPVIRQRVSLPELLPDPLGSYFPHRKISSLPGALSMSVVKRILKRAGYSCYGTNERFYGVRHRYAPVATLLFHISFFLLLLGGLTSYYTRFSGVVDLAEGEVFHGELERYTGRPALPKIGGLPDATIEIRNVTPLVEARTPTGLKVTLADERSRLHTIDINQPYKKGSISFVVKDLGLAPLLIMRDSSGRELDGAFVKLDIMRGKQDGFRMGGYEFKTRFYPDHVLFDGEDKTRSDEFNNPVLVVIAEKDGKQILDRVPYRAGASIQLGAGVLELSRLSYWVRFTVVKEQGVLLVYAGFLLACSGLVWRLGFYRREVAGSLWQEEGGQTLCLALRSEFYRALGEEELETLYKGFVADVSVESTPPVATTDCS